MLPDPDPLVGPSVNKELLDEAVPDPPLPNLRPLNDNPQSAVPPKPPEAKRKRQNTTSVCVLIGTLISELTLRTTRQNSRNG